MSIPEQDPSDYELSPSVEVLSRRFIQRWDRYPKQLKNGVWISVHQPLHVGLLFAHLRGEITLGSYLLNSDSKGRFLVLDADNKDDWQQLRNMAVTLEELGCPNYIEPSRRGGHLWFFFNDWLAGNQVREFASGLLVSHQVKGVEIYPKQGELEEGPGSLIRLPFGKHQLNQRRYPFCDSQGIPIASSIRDQLRQLASPLSVPEAALIHFMEQGKRVGDNGRFRPSQTAERCKLTIDDDMQLSERIKATMGVRTFVNQFVNLSASGKGLCPFHDDHKASFSVNDKENYWHCFTCNIGGSIIDFWMYKQGCDFPTAVRQLANNLLGNL